MDGLLTEIKTVSNDQQSSSITPVSEAPRRDGLEKSQPGSASDPTSLNNVLTLLRSNPDIDQLAQLLVCIDPSNKDRPATHFDLRVASPATAQILNALVSVTAPDHWELLVTKTKGSRTGAAKVRASLLRCLSSVAGVSCLLAQIRSLIALFRASSEKAKASGSQIQLRNILSVVSALLEPKDFCLRLYTNIEALYANATQKQIAWKEFLSLIAASRVLSTAAEALSLLEESEQTMISWIGDGYRYASWLGANICHMASKPEHDNVDAWKALASLMGRALSLGYTDQLVREVYTGLLVNKALSTQYNSLFDNLRPTEQVAFLEASLRDIEKKYFSTELSGSTTQGSISPVVCAVAGLCSSLVGNRPQLQGQLIDWLAKGQGGSIQTSGLRRALIAGFGDNEDLTRTLFTKSLKQSNDKFYIKHAPLRSQEANTQVILLAAGSLKRLNHWAIKELGHSGVFLNTVSNRLAASSTKARFLGMIIGTAVSRLVEKPGKEMKFGLDEMESEEALWYLSLLEVNDSIGSLESLRAPQNLPTLQKSATKTPPASTTRQQTAKIVSIEEIDDAATELSDDEDDLIPYEKPDEDPSDSDDDPTLIQRNKPTAPIYIRDLITYLRDTENVERYELALTTAPSLIRRKTGFGTELAENIEELALVTVGLQEQSKLFKFHEYRLQSMIALIVSNPLKMGRWFSAMFFDGDLSQVQRSAVLTALGLSARELAGTGQQDAETLGLPALPDSTFASKKLPANLEALYTKDESPISSLSKKISQASLQPLAANAADAASGPNALKVRTFSSRMEVEQKRQQREAQRQKSTVKDLHKVLSEGFFFPLKGRFEMMLIQFSSSTSPSYNPFFVPHILCLFIQTLTLILSTMGPHNPFLPTLTHETLSFLLSLYSRPISDDLSVLSALLSLFLAVIDLNVASGSSGEERLVTEYATQVLELHEWTGEVFDRTPAVQGDDPREQLRMLAAGVMVKLGEVTERYQGRLMGVNSGFKY
ncbi:telomere length regulation protein-domain-containing protein [Aspergillus floccosus]